MRIYLLIALLFAGAFSSLSAQRQRQVWWGDLQRQNEPPPNGVIRIYFDKWGDLYPDSKLYIPHNPFFDARGNGDTARG